MHTRIVTRSLLVFLAVSVSLAQTPLGPEFTYQGRLKDGGGPANGSYDFQFTLYDAAAGGSPVATDTADDWPVAAGLFTAWLDFGAGAFNGQARWLELGVRPWDSGGAYTILSPRQELTPTPYGLYAMSAANADTVDGFHAAAAPMANTLLPLDATAKFPNSVLRTGSGNGLDADLIDGLDSAAFLQAVPIPLTLSGSNTSHIIQGENGSTTSGAAAVSGIETGASGQAYGVYGRSDSSAGRGVYGWATRASGSASGVYGQSDGSSGYGIVGFATSTGSNPTCGGYFRSDSTNGRAVFGWASAPSGSNRAGHFICESTGGIGVEAEANAASGSTYGVYGRSVSSNGCGVAGVTSAASGTTMGGYFYSASPDGFGMIANVGASSGATTGVRGWCASTSGRGVHGWAGAGDGTTTGVHGQSDSTSGRGVFGEATAASGITYGGLFESASTSGRGVYAIASANTGTTYGVHGECYSSAGYAGYFVGSGADALYVENNASGRGIRAVSTADTALWALTTSGVAGVDGRNASTTGRGVYGYATASSGTNYGVYGRTASGSGYGVYALGNLGASGTKSFQIDHPDDPENKYLLHYAAESPEVINFYRGTVTLDERGEAAIELPNYFAKINKTPSYQLTAIGAPMPMLHVAEKISDGALSAGQKAGPEDAIPVCSFRIAGGVPGGEVSWRVEAVRNDLRMRLHGAPVEREKAGSERGKYQHPEYYGLPAEMGVDFEAEHVRQPPGGPTLTGANDR